MLSGGHSVHLTPTAATNQPPAGASFILQVDLLNPPGGKHPELRDGAARSPGGPLTHMSFWFRKGRIGVNIA